MPSRIALLLAFVLALFTTPTLVAQDSGYAFQKLFDGKTLDGWTRNNGTATYRVEDNCIVGTTSEGSPNSFLCTKKTYGDFELLFEVKVDNRLNSGVQIRSNCRGGAPDGRVNGPQVEIESSNESGSTSGYVYGEAAGGWMTPDQDRTPHQHLVREGWNSYRVVATGPKIQTWVNGHQISDLIDDEKLKTHPEGFIGLQVHSIGGGAGPYEVRWRNIKIRDLTDFKPLYNGEDLAGWKTTGNWLPQEDGSLLIEPRDGEQGWQRYDAYLWSEQKYGDFILDLEYNYPPNGNSGVYFRVDDRNDPVEKGIEVQILDSSKNTAPLGHHDHGGVIRTQGPTRNMSKPPGEWNHMIVACIGNNLAVTLNGEQIIELKLDQSPMKDRPASGYIGLQDHGQPNNLRFRNIRIKEIK